MALAVASTSTALANSSTTLSFTAPTGIQTGDLLLIIALNKTQNDTAVTCTGFTNLTSAFTFASGGKWGRISVLGKIAVLADESASTYTVNGDGTAYFGTGTMFRVTGYGSNTPSVFASDTNVVYVNEADVVVSESISALRPSSTLSVIAAAYLDDSSMSGEMDIKDYVLNSGDTNPTWTEILSESHFSVPTNQYGGMSVAYAVTTATSAITGYGFEYATTSIDETVAGLYLFFTIQEPVNASGSNTLATAGSETFSGSGVTNVSGSNTLVTANSVPNTHTGKGTTPTQWTNDPKPSTSWSNETL